MSIETVRSHCLQWRYLILRRLSQMTVLALFMTSTLIIGWTGGVEPLKGNLSSSQILGVVPMSDPLAVLQSLMAGHPVLWKGLLGAAIVVLLYGLLGGRSFCSWVCPVNMITDLAAWLRRKLAIRNSHKLPRQARYWILGMVLVLPLVTGMMVWELFNPISQLTRGLIFGMGTGWYLIAGIFLFDLLVSNRGWCGHLCPLGAFYSLLGRISPLHINATKRHQCDDCMDCYAVCPEPQILPPALKAKKGNSPVLNQSNCTRCGRCIDVCDKQVFEFRASLYPIHPTRDKNHDAQLITTTRQPAGHMNND
ncbi:quinol dehydrogenase ferredoxin subunit NapH [Endozoicomonas ascidiicola]|uniref:quinol dehydrogenase ferredoxin subunit NapH n=1 Tax=Endozoicomonas ascidiicola TaxID=1698521 RepID=UPI00082B2D71|nr:quinol dehydrogenase ferredoxin subunit NapH [Endozoicomonas ascidiicola]